MLFLHFVLFEEYFLIFCAVTALGLSSLDRPTIDATLRKMRLSDGILVASFCFSRPFFIGFSDFFTASHISGVKSIAESSITIPSGFLRYFLVVFLGFPTALSDMTGSTSMPTPNAKHASSSQYPTKSKSLSPTASYVLQRHQPDENIVIRLKQKATLLLYGYNKLKII